MGVYVDTLRPVPSGPMKRYGSACHLVSDTLSELHRFAERLGLRRAWAQRGHYDLTPGKRSAAVRLGAHEVEPRIAAVIRRKLLNP